MTDTFTHQLRVRYAECDAQGIVFNGNWFLYFDTVMTEYWRELIGGYNHLPEQFGVETVVVCSHSGAVCGMRFWKSSCWALTAIYTASVGSSWSEPYSLRSRHWAARSHRV